MRLNITKIRPQDYGEYHCISKNDMGITRAVFHVQGECYHIIQYFSILMQFMTWLNFIFYANRYSYFKNFTILLYRS